MFEGCTLGYYGGMRMIIMTRPVRRGTVRRAVTAAVVTCGGALGAVLLAACGSAAPSGAVPSSSATPPGSPPGSGTASPAATTPSGGGGQCATTALRAVANRVRGGAAAGTDYVPIDFTNISGHACVMFGFPGVSFVTGHPGQQIGDPAARQATYGPVTVTLAPGGVAHAWLALANAGNFPAATCRPVTANWLRIYPPDQFGALYVSFTAQVCSGRITGGSTPLMILPVRPGPGTAQHVP